MIENGVIYLVFWILNECICIGTRKVLRNAFLILGITLIKWILLQTKTILFVGQNLNAKTTLFVEQREYLLNI